MGAVRRSGYLRVAVPRPLDRSNAIVPARLQGAKSSPSSPCPMAGIDLPGTAAAALAAQPNLEMAAPRPRSPRLRRWHWRRSKDRRAGEFLVTPPAAVFGDVAIACRRPPGLVWRTRLRIPGGGGDLLGSRHGLIRCGAGHR